MRVEVARLTRRGAAVMRKPEIVTAESVRFGRGTGNEVALTDLRLELLVASLSQRADGLFVEQRGASPLRVNGHSTSAALVHPGDEILIGPYKIVIAQPPEGFDAALSVELVQPMGDALQRLMRQSRLRLEDTGLSKRRTSWAMFVVFAVLCLVAPNGASPSGHIGHRRQQPRCAECHEEHRGLDSLVIRERALCIDCHPSLAEAAPSAGVRDV